MYVPSVGQVDTEPFDSFIPREEHMRRARKEGLCKKCPYSAMCMSDPHAGIILFIRMHRQATGASLATAKKYVEERMLCR